MLQLLIFSPFLLPWISSLSFSFESFGDESLFSLHNTHVTNNELVVNSVAGGFVSTGVFLKQRVNFCGSFDVNFVYKASRNPAGQNRTGEGFMFVVQNVAVDAYGGGYGGALGVECDGPLSNNGFAVEFDFNDNSEERKFHHEKPCDHIGINYGSPCQSQISECGAAVDFYVPVRITYNTFTHYLNIFHNGSVLIRKYIPSIEDIVGSCGAWVGFTSSQGARSFGAVLASWSISENVCEHEGHYGPSCLPICFSFLSDDVHNVCSGGGNCTAPETCSCTDEFYFGPDCSECHVAQFCQPENTRNCSKLPGHDFYCHCLPSYVGKTCHIKISSRLGASARSWMVLAVLLTVLAGGVLAILFVWAFVETVAIIKRKRDVIASVSVGILKKRSEEMWSVFYASNIAGLALLLGFFILRACFTISNGVQLLEWKDFFSLYWHESVSESPLALPGKLVGITPTPYLFTMVFVLDVVFLLLLFVGIVAFATTQFLRRVLAKKIYKYQNVIQPLSLAVISLATLGPIITHVGTYIYIFSPAQSVLHIDPVDALGVWPGFKALSVVFGFLPNALGLIVLVVFCGYSLPFILYVARLLVKREVKFTQFAVTDDQLYVPAPPPVYMRPSAGVDKKKKRDRDRGDVELEVEAEKKSSSEDSSSSGEEESSTSEEEKEEESSSDEESSSSEEEEKKEKKKKNVELKVLKKKVKKKAKKKKESTKKIKEVMTKKTTLPPRVKKKLPPLPHPKAKSRPPVAVSEPEKREQEEPKSTPPVSSTQPKESVVTISTPIGNSQVQKVSLSNEIPYDNPEQREIFAKLVEETKIPLSEKAQAHIVETLVCNYVTVEHLQSLGSGDFQNMLKQLDVPIGLIMALQNLILSEAKKAGGGTETTTEEKLKLEYEEKKRKEEEMKKLQIEKWKKEQEAEDKRKKKLRMKMEEEKRREEEYLYKEIKRRDLRARFSQLLARTNVPFSSADFQKYVDALVESECTIEYLESLSQSVFVEFLKSLDIPTWVIMVLQKEMNVKTEKVSKGGEREGSSSVVSKQDQKTREIELQTERELIQRENFLRLLEGTNIPMSEQDKQKYTSTFVKSLVTVKHLQTLKRSEFKEFLMKLEIPLGLIIAMQHKLGISDNMAKGDGGNEADDEDDDDSDVERRRKRKKKRKKRKKKKKRKKRVDSSSEDDDSSSSDEDESEDGEGEDESSEEEEEEEDSEKERSRYMKLLSRTNIPFSREALGDYVDTLVNNYVTVNHLQSLSKDDFREFLKQMDIPIGLIIALQNELSIGTRRPKVVSGKKKRKKRKKKKVKKKVKKKKKRKKKNEEEKEKGEKFMKQELLRLKVAEIRREQESAKLAEEEKRERLRTEIRRRLQEKERERERAESEELRRIEAEEQARLESIARERKMREKEREMDVILREKISQELKKRDEEIALKRREEEDKRKLEEEERLRKREEEIRREIEEEMQKKEEEEKVARLEEEVKREEERRKEEEEKKLMRKPKKIDVDENENEGENDPVFVAIVNSKTCKVHMGDGYMWVEEIDEIIKFARIQSFTTDKDELFLKFNLRYYDRNVLIKVKRQDSEEFQKLFYSRMSQNSSEKTKDGKSKKESLDEDDLDSTASTDMSDQGKFDPELYEDTTASSSDEEGNFQKREQGNFSDSTASTETDQELSDID